MGKKCCCNGNDNSMNMMLMMMMMQMMQKNDDALTRITGKLDQNGQYSPAMQQYLSSLLGGMPQIPGQSLNTTLPPPTAPNPTTSAANPLEVRYNPAVAGLWRW